MAFFDSSASKLYVAQYDLTPSTTEVSGPGGVELLDITSLADSGQKNLRGIARAAMNWRGLYNDSATEGSQPGIATLRAATAGTPVSYYPKGDTIEYPGWGIAEAWGEGFDITARVGQAASVAGTFTGAQQREITSLAAMQTVTATTNGTGIDEGGAPSTTTGYLFYHILAWSASGGNARWQLLIQDDDNSGFTSPASFKTVNITAVGSGAETFSGASQQYIRQVLSLDASSGSITIQAGYVRE